MNKKAFTLIELLVTILIISLLSGTIMFFTSSIYKTNEERYYDAIESNILLAGNDYFSDHRDELPTGSNYSEVSLANLIDNKYIEPVADTNGNVCRNGSVFAYRENNKFKYEVCLVECGNYSSRGRYCEEAISREIEVSAKTKTTNKSYNVTKSYNKADYVKNENVIVTLGMNEKYNITKYIVKNTKGGSDIVCNTTNGNTCIVEINTSGTYKVEAYEAETEISTKYINVKIARNGSDFTLNTSDGQRKYLISQSDCLSNKKTKNVIINIIKGKANDEYKTIEYKIDNGSYVEIDSLSMNLSLESGHHNIDVAVTNYLDNVSVETISIDVSYLINIEYNDDNSTATHEVVKGQTYNYLSSLPVTKNGNNIKWYKGETLINPSTDIVGENCTYKLDGITKISYTLSYSDNLFAARTQSANGVVATYTEDGSYLTLDGAATSKSFISPLWNYEKRNISAGDQYKITVKYISGTLTCSDSATCTGSNGKPVFVLELTKNGSNLSNRDTSPYSYKTVALPVSGTNEATFIVDSSKEDADGLKYWLWQNNENVATFSNYKVQIIVTKVHSKNVVYNEQYGDLDTPEKTGYTFNGWYTSITGGTKVTNATIYNTEGNQTIYARYTSHKLNLQYNGNGSDVTWCSNSSKYAMDSSKYAIIQSSSTRNIHVAAYGQYMSYTSGLNDYGNKSYLCFSNPGYKVVSGEEWVLSTNSSKKYSQNVITYTAAGIASDAGCDLKTTATCTAQVNVNWVPNDLIFNNQSISRSFSTSAQTFDLTEASNGTGTYIYTISSQPSGNYFTISAATATIKANTPSGSYGVVIKATDSKSNATKEATYTVTIGSVAATCPTLTAYSGTFDDTSHTIGVSGGSGGTIKYRTSTTGDWTTTKPTRTTAGTTTVYVMVTGDSNHSDKDCGNKTITIDKKALTITAKAQTINYGGSITTGTGQITSSGLVSGHSVTAVTLTASTTSATTSGTITPSAATIKNSGGTDRTSSYSITYTAGTLTINKVAATCPTLTAYSGTYDGAAHTITVSGGSGGTVKYRTSTSESWTTTKPSRTAAGTTTVYVMVTGDSNHSDKDCGNKAITISQKALTITAKAQTINYGSSIATGTGQVTVSGLVSGDSLTAITLKASTTNVTTSGTITPSAATTSKGIGNYSVTYKTGVLTIKAVPSSITCANRTYNGSPQNMYSSYSGCTPSTNKTAKNAGTYTVSCTGDSNHTNSSCSAKMNKANPSFIITESSATFYVGNTKDYAVVPGVAGNRIDYLSGNNNVVSMVKVSTDATCKTAGQQCIFRLTGVSEGSKIEVNHVFTPADTTNYNSVSVKIIATVVAPPCYKMNCNCQVSGSWKTLYNKYYSTTVSNFVNDATAKQGACDAFCRSQYTSGLQSVTVMSVTSPGGTCPASGNDTGTCYPWARKATCSAESHLSGIIYYQTQAQCTAACNNLPAAHCGCSCYSRTC